MGVPHKPDKGKYGGSCNRESCQDEFAFCEHRLSPGLHYCIACANGINRLNMSYDGKPIVIIPDNIMELIDQALDNE